MDNIFRSTTLNLFNQLFDIDDIGDTLKSMKYFIFLKILA